MKYETKMLMYNNAYLMIQSLIKTETDFKLIIYQNNDWDKDLPEKIKKEFNNKLLLTYTENNIDLCEIDDNVPWILDACEIDFGSVFSRCGSYGHFCFTSDIFSHVSKDL